MSAVQADALTYWRETKTKTALFSRSGSAGVKTLASRMGPRQRQSGLREQERDGKGRGKQSQASELGNKLCPEGLALKWTKWLSYPMFMGSWTIKPASLQMSS